MANNLGTIPIIDGNLEEMTAGVTNGTVTKAEATNQIPVNKIHESLQVNVSVAEKLAI
jgi:hypothetical protein